MEPTTSSLSFLLLLSLQIIQTLFVAAIPIFMASWLYRKWPYLLFLGWVAIFGIVLFWVVSYVPGKSVDWPIPLSLVGLVTITSLFQYLRHRRSGEKLGNLIGMNGLAIGGIALLTLGCAHWRFNYVLPVKGTILEADACLLGPAIIHCFHSTTYYTLGHHRINEAQYTSSVSLSISLAFLTLLTYCFLWMPLEKLETYRYKLGL